MGQKKSVLVMRDTGMNNNEILAEKLSTDWNVQILSVRDDPDFFNEMVKNMDAIVGGPIPNGVPKTTKLKLYQVPFTGYDWITPAELPIGATLCNTHEHETTIAEHLMAGMLEWQTGLMRDTHPVMQKYSFNGRDINKGPHHRELRGSTVGIIGYGHIGREIARRCKAFDMTVMAVSRTMRKEPELVDWYGTVEDIDALLQRSDFVINCAPGGEETRGMIDRRCFSMMKSDAIIANVGRGEVIDEKALYEALSSRRIRGGIIDVWYKYPGKKNPNPWPSKFPFHKLDNIIMSPHNSAWTQAMSHRRWDFVAANLDRLSKGLELKNFCFDGERVD